MFSVHREHHFQHRSEDVAVIQEILLPFQPTRIIELGTDEGGFAAMLADWSLPWGSQVFTFDIKAKFKPSLLTLLNLFYVEEDVLQVGGAKGVLALLATAPAGPPLLLYCDNGNKPREVELYAQHVPVGSILGVHDYNTEIMGSWVEPFVLALGFEPLGHAKMEALRNEWYTEPMTRFWLRKSDGGPA